MPGDLTASEHIHERSYDWLQSVRTSQTAFTGKETLQWIDEEHRRLKLLTRDLAKYHNAFSPILQLSGDIQYQVLLACSCEEIVAWSQTCQDMRMVARGHSGLWTNISSRYARYVPLQLQNSREATLDVYIADSGNGRHEQLPYSLLREVLSHASRVRSLELSFHVASNSESDKPYRALQRELIIRPVELRHWSKIEELSLSASASESRGPLKLGRFLSDLPFNDKGPASSLNLTKLELVNVSITDRKWPPCPRLRHFHLAFSSEAVAEVAHMMGMNSMLSFLRSAPQLEVLTLINAVSSSLEPLEPDLDWLVQLKPVDLPRLTSLTLEETRGEGGTPGQAKRAAIFSQKLQVCPTILVRFRCVLPTNVDDSEEIHELQVGLPIPKSIRDRATEDMTLSVFRTNSLHDLTCTLHDSACLSDIWPKAPLPGLTSRWEATVVDKASPNAFFHFQTTAYREGTDYSSNLLTKLLDAIPPLHHLHTIRVLTPNAVSKSVWRNIFLQASNLHCIVLRGAKVFHAFVSALALDCEVPPAAGSPKNGPAQGEQPATESPFEFALNPTLSDIYVTDTGKNSSAQVYANDMDKLRKSLEVRKKHGCVLPTLRLRGTEITSVLLKLGEVTRRILYVEDGRATLISSVSGDLEHEE